MILAHSFSLQVVKKERNRQEKVERPIVSTGNEDKKGSCIDSKAQLEENNDDIVQEEKPLCENDYHESMNSERYEKYISENICYNAPPNSSIVTVIVKTQSITPHLAGENSSTLTADEEHYLI